jgi:hypothetical protein
MGLNRVRVGDSPLVGSITPEKGRPTGGDTLDPTVLVEELQKIDPTFHADWGARHSIWHPQQQRFKGLFLGHKHITAMDRTPMRQWPEWDVSEELVELPIDEAMLHEDMPIIALNEKGEDRITTQETAYCWRMKPEKCSHVGWAHVFYRLLEANIHGITRGWFERTFRLNLTWLDSIQRSPMAESYAQVEQRTKGERVVDMNPWRQR